MAVGTGAITLQEVCNEMAGVQTSLQDCVDDYIAAGMNDTYWTSKPSDPVSLAEFRGYDGTPITYTAILLGAGTSGNLACAAATKTFYRDGTSFATATALYTNSTGTTFAGSQWYSDQSIYRFWTGSAFSTTAPCTI